MKGRKQDFALGLTAIAVLAVFVGTILFLYPALGARGRTIEIQFHHEGGMAPLRPGSAVVLGGSQDVGRVRDIRIIQVRAKRTAATTEPAPRAGQTAPSAGEQGAGDGDAGRKRAAAAASAHTETVFLITAELRQDVPLYGNCEITTDQPAVGGAGFVSILNVGTPDVPLTQPIEGLPPQSLAAAIGTLSHRLLARGGLVDHLEQAIDPDVEASVVHKVLASLDDLNALTRELRVQMNPNEQKTVLNKVHLVLDDLAATTTALREQLTPGNQAAVLTKVHLALDQLTASLSDATQLLQENRPVIRDTLASVQHAARTLDQDMLAALRTELDPANPASLLGKLHIAMDRVNASLDDLQTMTAAGAQMIVLSRPAVEKVLENFQVMSEQLRLTSQEVLLNPSRLIWGPGKQRADQLVVFQAAQNFAEAAGQLDNAANRLEAILKTLPAEGRGAAVDPEELRKIRDAVRASFQRFERAEQALWDRLK